MEIEEYLESNRRDKEYQEPPPLMEYKQRSFDCSGRKEYFREYNQKNREHHLRTSKEYRKRTRYKPIRDRREYYKQYYAEHREEKIAKVQARKRRIKEALNATG